MTYLLLLYLVAAFAIFLLPASLSKRKGLLLALVQLTAFAFFLLKKPQILSGNVLSLQKDWFPQVGLNFDFTLDGLSLAFALLITGIGALVFLYANAYMKSYPGTQKFYFYLTLFSGAMLGLVLSSNFIQLFIFWELTSILSFLLISFFHEKDSARDAAFQSLFITGLGGLLMLAGILVIGSIAGGYSLDTWITQAEEIKQSNLYRTGLILILLGVFTKSAQFPFHFWLPGAMQAPTPVSSYLHSATMVKAGVFLLARLNPILGGTQEWTYIIPLAGVITMLVGAYFAITQSDLKAILAYTTISALGILVLLLGIDTKLSVKAALVFLFVHAFYKATLFMLAGLIDKKTGTRDIGLLGGLRRSMPVTSMIAFLALLSMAGLPPMLGFIGKELIYEAKVQSPGIASILLVLGVTANALMVAVSLYVFVKVFLGKKTDTPKHPNETGFLFLIGPAILVIFSLILGLFPSSIGSVVESALSVVRAEELTIKLKLWHGFNQVFILSLFTVAFGLIIGSLVLWKEKFLEAWRWSNDHFFSIKFTEVFRNALKGFISFSERNTNRIQHGYHRYYILTIIVITTLLLWLQVYVTRNWEFTASFTLRPFYISGLVVIMIISTLYSIFSKSRLPTIISMGVTGYGIALIFLYYSAIDLAITQILVETLVIVMFVLILQKLPRFARLSKRSTKIRDLLIASSFGGVMTILALKAIHVEFNHPISDFFLENSYIKAYGENVVNVILVDFRALDTLGEITVLTIAALGVYVLITTNRKKA
jgi:multicomponent Na+:H+ antiporter subunit A